MIIVRICAGDYMHFLKQGDGSPGSVEPHQRQYKFVLIGDELIVGDVSKHVILVAMWECGLTLELLKAFDSYRLNSNVSRKLIENYQGKILAAGVIAEDGEVVDWESSGFEVTTPQSLKEPIQQLVRTVIPGDGWLGKNQP